MLHFTLLFFFYFVSAVPLRQMPAVRKNTWKKRACAWLGSLGYWHIRRNVSEGVNTVTLYLENAEMRKAAGLRGRLVRSVTKALEIEKDYGAGDPPDGVLHETKAASSKVTRTLGAGAGGRSSSSSSSGSGAVEASEEGDDGDSSEDSILAEYNEMFHPSAVASPSKTASVSAGSDWTAVAEAGDARARFSVLADVPAATHAAVVAALTSTPGLDAWALYKSVAGGCVGCHRPLCRDDGFPFAHDPSVPMGPANIVVVCPRCRPKLRFETRVVATFD